MNFKRIIANIFKPNKNVSSNIIAGKPFDETYNESGIFEYHDNGFTVTYNDFTKTLQWNEITQMNAYKIDLITTDCIVLEIVYGDEVITINEELRGWYQFVIKTKQVFPSIPKDWDINIMFPPFAENRTTIYKR